MRSTSTWQRASQRRRRRRCANRSAFSSSFRAASEASRRPLKSRSRSPRSRRTSTSSSSNSTSKYKRCSAQTTIRCPHPPNNNSHSSISSNKEQTRLLSSKRSNVSGDGRQCRALAVHRTAAAAAAAATTTPVIRRRRRRRSDTRRSYRPSHCAQRDLRRLHSSSTTLTSTTKRVHRCQLLLHRLTSSRPPATRSSPTPIITITITISPNTSRTLDIERKRQ